MSVVPEYSSNVHIINEQIWRSWYSVQKKFDNFWGNNVQPTIAIRRIQYFRRPFLEIGFPDFESKHNNGVKLARYRRFNHVVLHKKAFELFCLIT